MEPIATRQHRSRRTAATTIRLDPEVAKVVDARAMAENRSRAGQIAHYVRLGLIADGIQVRETRTDG